LGAQDKEEGKWEWLGGPEKDQVFWNGYAKEGESKSLGFTKWFNNEPNNIENEDCSTFFPDGWNDVSCDTEKAALVIEYGNDPLKEETVTSPPETVTVEEPKTDL